MARWLWTRLVCVTITPLGVEVDPEVYWRKATASPSGTGEDQRAGAGSSSSVAIQEPVAPAGVRSNQLRTRCNEVPAARATAGCASARMASSRGIMREERGGSGGRAQNPARK